MKKSEWSDNEIEELLRQMPKIQDHRHPRDIYQNLSIKKQKRSIHLVPYIAAAAALLLFFILVPNLIGNFSNSKEARDQASTFKKQDASSENISLKMEKNKSSITRAFPYQSLTADEAKTAVYEEDVMGGKVLTYWIPDVEGRFLIPVSTIETNIGNKTWIDLYNEKMAVLQEENWGLSEYYPMDATLKIEQDSVIVVVSPNNRYANGSSNEMIFLNALKKDFSANHMIHKIKFKTNDESGIELGNTGKIDEVNITEDAYSRHAYFFYNPKGSTVPFLVPSIDKYDDISAALKAMNSDILNMDLKASLRPFNIEEVAMEGNRLYLTLDSNKVMINDANTLHSFEALLLTAKEFGAEYVIINNPPIQNLGQFDLTQEIKVPVAPNLKYPQ